MPKVRRYSSVIDAHNPPIPSDATFTCISKTLSECGGHPGLKVPFGDIYLRSGPESEATSDSKASRRGSTVTGGPRATTTRIPGILKWRRAKLLDVPGILVVLRPSFLEMYGDIDVEDMIEKSFLCMVQENVDEEIISFLCVENFPNTPSVPKNCWDDWIHQKYRLMEVSVWNTLFIHALAWDPRYSNYFFTSMLRSLFLNFTALWYLIIVAPPAVPVSFFVGDNLLQEFFTRLLPQDLTDFNTCQTVFLCMRENHVPQMKIRYATEEDNDDIVPILDTQCKRLRELYGDFYIAELVGQKNNISRRLIVAEMDDHAVGVLCLNSSVNYDIINHSYELAPFMGLRKVAQANPESDAEGDKEAVVEQTQVEDVSSEQSEQFSNEEIQTEPKHKNRVEYEQIASEVEAQVMKMMGKGDEDDDNTEEIESQPDDYSYLFDDLSISTNESKSNFSIHLLSHNVKPPDDIDPSLIKFYFRTEDDVESVADRGSSKSPRMKIPDYEGEPNAFLLELFAVREDLDDRLVYDFLAAAFEVFPGLDFMVLGIPSCYPSFPLLSHFTKVSPRPIRTLEQEIYVLHRNSILGELVVRNATTADDLKVSHMLKSVQKGEQIFAEFWTAVNWKESAFQAFVCLSNSCIVGVAVIKEEDDAEYLRAHYNIEQHVNFNQHKLDGHCILRHLAISPLFQPHARFVMREILRLSDTTSMYYYLYPQNPIDRQRSLATTLAEMIPVSPRKAIIYDANALGENMPKEAIIASTEPFALYHINSRVCSMNKVGVNSNIVVVGAGDTGLAFLEGLFFSSACQYLSFTNVTIVAPHGFPYMKTPWLPRDYMIPFTGKYNNKYMKLVSLRTWANVVPRAMNTIDRKNKTITLDDKTHLSYDMLFLFCGTQYQKPKQFKNDKCEDFPANVYIINTDMDASAALKHLKENFDKGNDSNQSTDDTIIVYGHTLEAYCCLSALVNVGIAPEKITFVEPFPVPDQEFSVSLFNDNEVDEIVQTAINEEGIRYLQSYYFQGWEKNPGTGFITSATFESRFRFLNIPCIAMFYYDHKSVSTKTFTAINRAGLVFDGRLVIDKNCHTNDPYIWAAGTMTKYSRRYYASHRDHEHFSSKEIGATLAQRIVTLLDPTSRTENPLAISSRPSPGSCRCAQHDEEDIQTDPRLDYTVRRYKAPLMVSCVLPGSYNYLSVTKPGLVIPLDAGMSQDTYGQSLVTGDQPDDPHGYFRLHLNQYSTVEDITCIAKNEIDIDNIVSLWGKHEMLLNNLLARFDQALILDLYAFFKEPWAYALYHDQFELLRESNRDILCTPTDIPGDSILDDIIKSIEQNGYNKITQAQRNMLEARFKSSQYKDLIEQGLLDFIFTHRLELTMYAHPDTLSEVLGNFEPREKKTK